jgi:hypothetical protein
MLLPWFWNGCRIRSTSEYSGIDQRKESGWNNNATSTGSSGRLPGMYRLLKTPDPVSTGAGRFFIAGKNHQNIL